MKSTRIFVALIFMIIGAIISCSQSFAVSERNWIDSSLYHREIPAPADAGGCSHELWMIKTNPTFDYHGESLPKDVCVYHALGFSYAVYERKYTSIGLTNWMTERKIAVKKDGQEYAVPISNLNMSSLEPLAYLGKSSKFLYVWQAPGHITETGASIVDDFISKIKTDLVSGYYVIPNDAWRAPILNSNNNYTIVNGISGSSNGQWLVLISNGQFIRVNLLNGRQDIIAAHNFYQSYLWPVPMFDLFINNTGSLAGYLAKTDSSQIYNINDNCINPTQKPLTYRDPVIYTNCLHNDMTSFLYHNVHSLSQTPSYQGTRISADSKILTFSVDETRWYQISYENFTGEKYLALGDSYTSGEGDIDQYGEEHYLAGTNIAGDYAQGVPREMCHLSDRSYPFLLGAQAGLQRRFGMDSVACSGAIRLNIANTTGSLQYKEYINGAYFGQLTSDKLNSEIPRLKGIVNANYLQQEALDDVLPGRIQQIEQLKKLQPYAATVQISGNDLGFGPIMASCVMNWTGDIDRVAGVDPNDCDWANPEFRSKIARAILDNRRHLVDLYKTLHEASPATQLYAVSYPLFIKQTAVCWNMPTLSAAEQEFAIESITFANATIKSAASEAGIRYIDIQDALGDQVICGKSGAMTEPFDYINAAAMADIKKGMVADAIIRKYNLTDPQDIVMVHTLYRLVKNTADQAAFWQSPYLNLMALTQQLVHPNAEGHRLIADKIIQALGNESIVTAKCDEKVIFCPSTSSSTVPAIPNYFGPDLTATGTIVEISSIQFRAGIEVGGKLIDSGYTGAVWAARQGAKIYANLHSQVPLAGPLRITLHSSSYNLGEIANAGSESLIVIPNNTKVGMHILEISGKTQTGQDYYALSPIAIIGSQYDEDVDGIPDDKDACLYRSTCIQASLPTTGTNSSTNSSSNAQASEGVKLVFKQGILPQTSPNLINFAGNDDSSMQNNQFNSGKLNDQIKNSILSRHSTNTLPVAAVRLDYWMWWIVLAGGLLYFLTRVRREKN